MDIRQYNPDVLSCLANLSSDEVFTPPKLANDILDLLPPDLWQDKNATFLDPCCKSGVFLREIAKRLLKGLEGEFPDLQERINHIFHKQIFGLAITELTALLSRRSVYCSKNADGIYSVVTGFEYSQGKLYFESSEHTFMYGSCIFCGASQELYERGEVLEKHAYPFIHNALPTEVEFMNFDVIIGNPPYQLSDGGAGASARPIYQLFIKKAMKLNPRFLVMITPSRWFAGGKGLDDFRDNMIKDRRIRKIIDYPNAKDCFPETSIGGGVNYFLWERDSMGDCEVINVYNNTKSSMIRRLDEFPFLVRNNKAISIIHKIQALNEDSISSFISSRNPFGFPSSARGFQKSSIYNVKLFSSQNQGYVDRESIVQGSDLINKYKLMISKLISEHAGEPDKNGMFKVLSTTQILKPNEICTDSYLIAYSHDSYDYVRNFYSYLLTKFARFLLLQAISSINLSKEKFLFIPIQDFSKIWVDAELYAKYSISEDEIEYIESLIRPMEMNNGEQNV